MKAYIESGRLICPICEQKGQLLYGSYVLTVRRIVKTHQEDGSEEILVGDRFLRVRTREDDRVELLTNAHGEHLLCLRCDDQFELPAGLMVEYV